MVSLNLGLQWALGKSGGIHNLILEETYLRGVICNAFFIMFFLTFFLVNLNESLKNKSYIQLIPNFFVLAFFIYEFTVSGYLISYSGFMTVFYAAISAGIYHNKIDLSEFGFRNPEKIKRIE
jgi:O-antigen ligase